MFGKKNERYKIGPVAQGYLVENKYVSNRFNSSIHDWLGPGYVATITLFCCIHEQGYCNEVEGP